MIRAHTHSHYKFSNLIKPMIAVVSQLAKVARYHYNTFYFLLVFATLRNPKMWWAELLKTPKSDNTAYCTCIENILLGLTVG